jgi:hypothetical protein
MLDIIYIIYGYMVDMIYKYLFGIYGMYMGFIDKYLYGIYIYMIYMV